MDRHLHFQDDPAQHLVVEFDQNVTVANNALSLTNLTTGASFTQLVRSGSDDVYAWTVNNPSQAIPGALPRGNY